MSRNQNRVRGTGQEQVRARAREQTRRLRHELDLLADPDTFSGAPAAGIELAHPDVDRFDETDGDEHLREGDAEEPESGEAVDLPTTTTLRRLLGTQPPVAIVQLSLADDVIRARPLLSPRPALRGALEELVALTEATFQRGRESLTAAEWADLIGTGQVGTGMEPASHGVTRLLLLARIAITGADKVPLGEKASFQPNNRGLERYAGKLALLPDGLAFSLRLLLKGAGPAQRSRDPELANHPFGALPEAVKLLALRRALAREEQEGEARSDEDFRASLGQALTELGLPMPRPFWKHVEMLRSNLVRRGLPAVFPKRSERQRLYDASAKQ